MYGDGRSERIIRDVLYEYDPDERVYVATKAGRRLDPHTAERYNEENLREFIDRSRENLDVDTLDLVQLHCPPTDAYYQPETFEALERFEDEGRIDNYGVVRIATRF